MSVYNVSSNAKINLSLDIVSKRDNGYHNLKMIMHSINLCDNMSFKEIKEPRLLLSSNLSYLPCDERNIVYRAYNAFYENTNIKNQGFDVYIEKNVPVCAGLGGSSTNAASTLLFLNDYYNNPLTTKKLMQIGEKLGADVPYCICGGTCLAEGIGEILTPLPSLPPCHIVVAKPQNKGLSTKNIFSMVNLDEIEFHPDTQGMIKALYLSDLSGIAKRMYNVLEMYSVKECPEIALYKDMLNEKGALGSLMSGSGNAIFGIFDSEDKAKEAALFMKKLTNQVYII